MTRTNKRLLALVLMLVPAVAAAHTGQGASAGLLSGLLHPLTGLDHVVAMIAVGLWAAQLGRPALWLLPVTFPVMMAVGGLLGMVAMPLHGVEIGIAASAIVLGALVLAAARPWLWLSMIVVGVFAIFHGHAHGAELAPGQSGLLYSLGFVVATAALHAVGIGVGSLPRSQGGRRVLRAAGGAVAVAGVYFLAGAVA